MMKHMSGERFSQDFPTAFSFVFRLSRLMPEWLYIRIFGA
jgi:hypothetical protein